jgi:hypothetical protein
VLERYTYTAVTKQLLAMIANNLAGTTRSRAAAAAA